MLRTWLGLRALTLSLEGRLLLRGPKSPDRVGPSFPFPHEVMVPQQLQPPRPRPMSQSSCGARDEVGGGPSRRKLKGSRITFELWHPRAPGPAAGLKWEGDDLVDQSIKGACRVLALGGYATSAPLCQDPACSEMHTRQGPPGACLGTPRKGGAGPRTWISLGIGPQPGQRQLDRPQSLWAPTMAWGFCTP